MEEKINIIDDYKILIVDDDEGLNRLIKKRLERENINVSIVKNGKDALNKIYKSNNYILLLDYKLPDMNASEILDILNDKNIEITFIIMTGLDDVNIAIDMLKSGAKDFLIKNADFINLLPSVVKRVINELSNEKKLHIAEDTLKKSENRYRGIVENIPLLICRFNPENGIITFVNNSTCKYFSKSIEELKNLSFYSLMDDKDSAKFKKNIKKLENEFSTTVYENIVNTPNGQRWQRWIIQPIFSEDGYKEEYQAIGEDITERKRTLNELMISESKFKELFNNMSSGVSVYRSINNGEDFVFVDFNESAENIENIKKDSILGKSVLSVFPNIREFGLFDVYKRVYSTGIPEHHPVSFYNDSRTSGWRENYVYKLATGEIVSIFNDVTEKKIAEQKILDSEKKLRNLMETIPIGIALTNPEGDILEVNSFALHMFGYDSLNEVNNLNAAFSYEDKDRREDFLKELLKKGRVKNFETRFIKRDGTIFWVLIDSIIQKKQDGKIQLINVFQDITEIKMAEEEARIKELQLIQTEKMASMGVLLSGIAHEINNPNNFILLNSSIVKDLWNEIVPILDKHNKEINNFKLSSMPYEEVRKEMKDILDGLIYGANRIKNIIENIKDFIRPDTGKWDQLIDINNIIKSAIVITNNIITKSTDNFKITFDKKVPLIKGNAQQLEQVIINLVVNACQSLKTKKDGIKIITFFNEEENKIMIKIEDEGVGISQEDLKKIIDPFFTTKIESGGTGLGLSISYNIIKKFNGELNFESNKDAGTIVSIILPVNL